MNVHIVTAHPDSHSLNSRLSAAAVSHFRRDGHAVSHTDLYAFKFEPVEGPEKFHVRQNPDRFFTQSEQRFNFERGSLDPDASAEIQRLIRCDLLIVQFPLWWFGVPAILKGWIDRMFVYGGLYSSARRFETGVMRGKRALLSVTTGSSQLDCTCTGREGDTRLILWPTLYAFRYVGFTLLEPFLAFGIRGDGEGRAKRDERILERYAEQLARLRERPIVPFNSAEDWDDTGQLKPGAPSHSPFICHR